MILSFARWSQARARLRRRRRGGEIGPRDVPIPGAAAQAVEALMRAKRRDEAGGAEAGTAGARLAEGHPPDDCRVELGRAAGARERDDGTALKGESANP